MEAITHVLFSRNMLSNILDRVKLPFRKEKELYLSLYKILGFYPRNISYYQLALMHKSVMKRGANGKPANNERLEFLGDAILDAIVGDIVYQHFPGKKEGFLTNTRSKLVQRETLNKLAQEMGISKLILSSGQNTSHNSYMGGNAFEALMGAIYLDRGYERCKAFMQDRILGKMLNLEKVAYKEVNFKSKLIEWSQKHRVKLEFTLDKQGKDDDGNPFFAFTVLLEGLEGCSGTGYSKKESQQLASKLTLEKLKKETDFADRVFALKKSRLMAEEQPAGEPASMNVETPIEAVAVVEEKQEETPIEAVALVAEKPKVNKVEVVVEPEHGDPISSVDIWNDKEFDLSDISAKEQTKEEIIAAAEAAAFEEAAKA